MGCVELVQRCTLKTLLVDVAAYLLLGLANGAYPSQAAWLHTTQPGCLYLSLSLFRLATLCNQANTHTQFAPSGKHMVLTAASGAE